MFQDGGAADSFQMLDRGQRKDPSIMEAVDDLEESFHADRAEAGLQETKE